jgi:hypothetical protein
MTTARVLTLITPTALPQARVLARSLRRHQPEWSHEVVVVAPEGWRAPPDDELELRMRSAVQLLDLDLEPLLGRYDDEELQMLLLPRLLSRRAKEGDGLLLHLPASVWVLDGLEPVAELLSKHSVLLAARVTSDLPDDGLEPSQAQLERVGRLAPLVMGTDGTAAAEGFLAWWEGQQEAMLGSLDGLRGGGRTEDRSWLVRLLELAPARFATAVLEDPGCNLSQWNLHGRELVRGQEGFLVDGRWPLRFLDLAGFEPDRPYRLSAQATRVRISRSPVLCELCGTYARELEQAGWRAIEYRHEIGRVLPDGTVYDEAIYKLHTRALALGETFDDVFEPQGARKLQAWLSGPAPRGGRHGITRYVFYRVAHERPDVMRAYPDLDGADGAEYVAWCWAFGQTEMGLSERFLPPRSGVATVAGQSPSGVKKDGVGVGASGAPHPLATREHVSVALDASATTEQASVAFDPSATTEQASVAFDPSATTEQASVAFDPSATTEHVSVAFDAPARTERACPAVRVTGYLGHTLGLGAAARGYVQALSAAGVPTSTASVPLDHLQLPVEMTAGYGRESFDDFVHDGRHGYEMVAVNADELPAFVERLGEDYFQGPRIGIWGWETNSIPARWARAFELVSEIWVYSSFMARNIGAVAPVPTIALPPPVSPPAQAAESLRLGVPEGFLFLFAFDYMSTIQRKNPVGLIEAFKRAFAPDEGPQLLLKTINAPLRPLAEEEVLWAAAGREDIHVIDCSLSSAERDGLMAACDCYVSLHRSEGFGLTLAEAMAIGKPVIGTGYSGNVDFMNAHNSYLVAYELGRVGPDCEIYPADGEWAQPSVEHAAALMRRVYEDPDEAARVGEQAREDIARQLSPQACGAAMRRRLEELDAGGTDS